MVVKVKILTAEGRAIEMRIRSRRRFAFPTADLPNPPPKRLALMCAGERLEMGLTTVQFGYAVYYMPAEAWRRFTELAAQHEALPCVLQLSPQ